MADVERESNNSDQIQQTNAREKDNENRGCKKVRKINSKKWKRIRSSTSTSSSSISSSSSSSSDEKRKSKKKRKHRRHEAFSGKVNKVLNQRKWKKISNLQKDLPF